MKADSLQLPRTQADPSRTFLDNPARSGFIANVFQYPAICIPKTGPRLTMTSKIDLPNTRGNCSGASKTHLYAEASP